MIFKNASVFLNGKFKKADIETKGDIITRIEDSIDSEEGISLDQKLLTPGFIDIHSHGCVGEDFSTSTEAGMKKMCQCYACRGVTSILATTMTEEPNQLRQAMRNIKNVMNSKYSGSTILGINMEGPFLGVDKKGAHDPNYLMPVNEEYFNELNELSGDQVKLIDIDPKYEGSLEFIEKYSKTKTISLAHTSCNYELAMKAFAAGSTHVTHLFNAMNGLHHRDPGIIGAVADNLVNAELIADGIHIHPSVIRMMFQLDPKKIVLISDSMSASGLEDGIYELGGQKVYVKDKKATLEDGTIAGSTCNVYEAVMNCIRFGIKREDAILSATYLPAKSVRMDHLVGEIAIGKKANLLVMDELLHLEQVYINGEKFEASL